MKPDIELDVIGNMEDGEPKRLHFEYISKEKKITLQIFDVSGEKVIGKIGFADKTIINFAKSVEEIRNRSL